MVEILKNVLLKDFSNFKIGGHADYFLNACDKESLREALFFVREKNIPYFILGGATNLLIADEGYQGAIIKIRAAKIEDFGNGKIYVEAGAEMSDVVRFACERGLAGLSWAGGLPGTFGGALRGNAGAFGGEIKDSIELVDSVIFNRTTGEIKDSRKMNIECNFGYRNSIFKEQKCADIIFSAILKLESGHDPVELQRQAQAKIDLRQARQPLEYPNIGSIFKNVPLTRIAAQQLSAFDVRVKADPFPVIPAARLISECGLKGFAIGGAEVSEKHPNFIINKNNASAYDVKAVMNVVKEKVFEKFNVALEQEVEVLT